jgi:hypothetical protein
VPTLGGTPAFNYHIAFQGDYGLSTGDGFYSQSLSFSGGDWTPSTRVTAMAPRCSGLAQVHFLRTRPRARTHWDLGSGIETGQALPYDACKWLAM